MRKAALAILLVLAPAGGLHAMTVAAFLQRADALERLGPAAYFSSDYTLLKGEIVRAGEILRAERAAAVRARRPLAFCPAGEPEIEAGELLAFFRAIPPQRRHRIHVRDALRALLVRKYPCRA